MRRIVITGNAGTVALSNDITFTIKPEPVETTTTMASGRVVVDSRGMRNVLRTPKIWVDKTNLSLLRRLISAERILSVTYPDTEGDVTERMMFDQPEYRGFKYSDDGVEIYYGIELTAKGERIMSYPYIPDVPESTLDEAYGIILDTLYGSEDA